jgi:hypothetical protein
MEFTKFFFVLNSFFPSIIQPFVAVISNTIFDILVRIKICTKPPKRYNISSTTQITLNVSNTQSLEAIDAERRRQKALKALKERLNKNEKDDANNSQWGNDDLTRKLLNQEHAIEEQTIYATKSNTQVQTVVSTDASKQQTTESTVIDLSNK